MTEPRISGFHHIHIICTDIEASERWFVDGVGAAVVEQRESRGTATTELSLAGARVLLRNRREGEDLATDGERRFGTDHFGLQVSDVDGLVETLRGRGVEIAIEPRNSPTNRIAFIKGPDNVLIELVEQGGHR